MLKILNKYLRMHRQISVVMLACMSGGAQLASAEPLWDEYIVVPAIAAGPKQWMSCPKGQDFKKAGAKKAVARCYQLGTFSDKDMGGPKTMPLQEVLDTHLQAAAGYRGEAVGVIPTVALGANTNYIDEAAVFIAYRLVKIK